MSSSLPTPHLMDDEGNQTQGESAASVTHGGLRRRGRMRALGVEGCYVFSKSIVEAGVSKSIKKEILDMYVCERVKYISVLEQAQGRIAITTDMWTAENQTKAYMAITAHFIDDGWALRIILLSFLEVSGSHTGQVLCDKLMGSLLELNIERKLSSIIVDNAATNGRMIDFMLLALDKNDLILGGQNYPTSNLFLRHVCDIRLRLNEWVSTPTYDEFRIMAHKMIEKFDKHWHDMSEILSIACIFDPKFKIRLVEYYFSMIYGDDATSRVHIVHGDCQSIVKKYKARYASADSSPSFVNVGNEEVKDELDTYLGEKLVPFNVEEDFDVLSWWKVNGGNYHILSRIVRDILAIPVTIVASESAFSTAVASSSPAYAKILDEESEIETDVEAVEVYEES
ncbi:hat family dimerization domain containing protein expressed [Citrus sinensis]|uniref:Hat family dimerization domain containing protein expressed n=1 Tax=Citrus sinensis TaxID=2711 RepID=A0ACB8M2E8_CITSI|nr:hat family dimerization domain containing protein expressed [Citrus sinensis]